VVVTVAATVHHGTNGCAPGAAARAVARRAGAGRAVSGVGRPERPLDPMAGPVSRFAADLRKLREESGRPAYWKLARRCDASKSALADAAAGRQLPSWRTVTAFVRACGHATDLPWWRARWEAAAAAAGLEAAGLEAAGREAAAPATDGGAGTAADLDADDRPSAGAVLPARRQAAHPARPGAAGRLPVLEAVVVADRARRRATRPALAVVAVLALLAGGVLAVRLARHPAPPGSGPAAAGPAGPAASLPRIPPLISASGPAAAAACGTATDRLPCQGRNPYDTGCSADAVEAVTANFAPVRIRIDYSPACQAVWAVLTAPPGSRTRLELDTASGFRTCYPGDCASTGPIDTTGCQFLPGTPGCMWTDMAHLAATVGAAATAVAVRQDATGTLSRRFVTLTGDDVPPG
jgi:Protein of unknown function (DUF2690)